MVLLVGNVTVTSIWKLYAGGTRDPVVIAFAQRMVTITDWFFTVRGILLLVVGGYGVGWLFVLVPIQVRQARDVRGFAAGNAIPKESWRLGRRWIASGLVATAPLVAATWIMLRKGW